MRTEQIRHFQKEGCLQEFADYREFIRPALDGVTRLLDLGTGAGYGVLAVSPCVESVVATDAYAQMLDAARSTCRESHVENVSFVEMPAERLDFPDGSFGAVQIRYSLHHFDDATKAISEAGRVLNDQGVLLLADAFFREEVCQVWTITSLLRHGRWTPYFTYRQHMDMLMAAGLRVEAMRPVLLEQSFDEFYQSAPESLRGVLASIVEHLTPRQRHLLHFKYDGDNLSSYAYDGFELVARKQ